ncbi:hypothetical protein [Methanobrevibacter intestini]|jgi:hypothetical protein|uniref:hypothetical protein n=1 Tax=Methanobrevibacter intestini TaxID=2911853 RepID=UPI003CFF01F9
MEQNDLKTSLGNLQKECNRLYDDYGATHNIIYLQIAINKLRHEYDLCDETECIYEEYVQ